MESAHEKFAKRRCPLHAILLLDDKQCVVGKINKLDLLKELEPKYEEMFTLRLADVFATVSQAIKECGL